MSKTKALGKGLSALITDAETVNINRNINTVSGHDNEQNKLVMFIEIPLSEIRPNPFQPRTTFDESSLQELADSIKLLGLIQPITVRPVGKRYQIISGERRFRASLLAGSKNIPAYIKSTDDQGMLEMAIVENIQRENLDSIEVAISFQRLIEECDLTQEAMAGRVGKNRSTITNYLRLLKLPAEIQLAIRKTAISMGHAKALLSLDNKQQQLKIANEIIQKDLSVRQTEQRIKVLKEKDTPKREDTVTLPDSYYKLLDIIGNYFDNNISIKRNKSGKGNITIQFHNDHEIEKFLTALENIK
ncbi:MAG: ParB/RepB/Spo0J family partition protein [Bacteroidales bacterium]